VTVTITRTHEEIVAIIKTALEAKGVKVSKILLTCSAGHFPGTTQGSVELTTVQGNAATLSLRHHQIFDMVCDAQTARGYPAPFIEPRFSAVSESDRNSQGDPGPTRDLSPILAEFVYQDHEIMSG
jgi:hypothetical protein